MLNTRYPYSQLYKLLVIKSNYYREGFQEKRQKGEVPDINILLKIQRESWIPTH